MQIKIRNNTLLVKLDSTAELIEKIVTEKPSGNSQGAIYVPKQYVGRDCLFVLIDPISSTDNKQSFTYEEREIEYYDTLIREIKHFKTSKETFTGRAYLPGEWIGKRVIGIVLDP